MPNSADPSPFALLRYSDERLEPQLAMRIRKDLDTFQSSYAVRVVTDEAKVETLAGWLGLAPRKATREVAQG